MLMQPTLQSMLTLPQRAKLWLISKHEQLAIMQVECAINRATKEKRVAELTDLLERSDVAFAVRYNKIPVKKFESFRRSLPADAKLCVAKNTLMKQAVSRVSFQSLASACASVKVFLCC